LETKYLAENYGGYLNLTDAKPVKLGVSLSSMGGRRTSAISKQSRVKIATASINPYRVISGDSNVCHYKLLSANDSIFEAALTASPSNLPKQPATITAKVGYIRLTRFSRASTAGSLGINSYSIDVRNNYGGVIQESMLTACTLLIDSRFSNYLFHCFFHKVPFPLKFWILQLRSEFDDALLFR